MKKVTIYTKDYCPYCNKVKALLKSKGVEFEEIDYMQLSTEKREELFEKTGGYMMVPQIFIGNEFIGGCDDLYALEDHAKLDEKLKD